jgi:hypothetical protein
MEGTSSVPKGVRMYRLFGNLFIEDSKNYLNKKQLQKLRTLEFSFREREKRVQEAVPALSLGL